MKWYGARRLTGRPRQAAHHPVDPIELVHRLGALGTGMMGDLVVAEVVGVHDRRAPVHLADDQVGRHVAHERRRGGLQDRERHAAPDARLDVAGALAARLEVLDDDRGPELDRAARDVVRVDEVQREGVHLESLAALGQLAVRRDAPRGASRAPGWRCSCRRRGAGRSAPRPDARSRTRPPGGSRP